jgi:hypothetical protein
VDGWSFEENEIPVLSLSISLQWSVVALIWGFSWGCDYCGTLTVKALRLSAIISPLAVIPVMCHWTGNEVGFLRMEIFLPLGLFFNISMNVFI